MNLQRIFVAILGIVLLGTGSLLLWANSGLDTNVSGILIRVGVMLLVVWIGYPALTDETGQHSLGMILLFIAGTFLVALRPRIFVSALLIGILAIAINFVWRYIGQEFNRK